MDTTPFDPAHALESDLFVVAPEVRQALSDGTAVVALESTIISHGLPRPENLRVATEVEDIVRSRGAVPATIAILDGHVLVGLDEHLLEQVANRDDVVKVSVRDIATLVARGGSGATTVAATSNQKLPMATAKAHSADDSAATTSPTWKARLRPTRACSRATGMADNAAPTT